MEEKLRILDSELEIRVKKHVSVTGYDIRMSQSQNN
jgi:hypothetical protein